jgi:hypothetical protein
MKIVILIASLFQLINFCFSKYVLNEKNEMIQVFDVQISSSMQKKPQTFLMDAKAIKLSSLKERNLKIKDNEFVEPNELGLLMGKTPMSDKLDDIHHKYLRNEKNRVWLPYSYAGEWKAIFNPNGTSIIANQLKRTSTSKKETPLITLQFSYDKDWEIISQSELNQIVSWLNENTNKRKNTKTLLKIKIKQAAYNYTIGKKHLEEAKAGGVEKSKRIQNEELSIKKVETDMNALTKDLEKALIDIANAARLVSASEKITQGLTNINENLAKQIQREKIAKSQVKVPNSDGIKMEIATIRKIINLPSQTPLSFKDEFSLSLNDAVEKAYGACISSDERVDECKSSLENYGLEKNRAKKLLRRFF